jgi:hypothetical protein
MYDDIRGSWWDDPEDDDKNDTSEYNPWEDLDPAAGLHWGYPDVIGDEEVYYPVEYECEICGRLRWVDMSGRCLRCAQEMDG